MGRVTEVLVVMDENLISLEARAMGLLWLVKVPRTVVAQAPMPDIVWMSGMVAAMGGVKMWDDPTNSWRYFGGHIDNEAKELLLAFAEGKLHEYRLNEGPMLERKYATLEGTTNG